MACCFAHCREMLPAYFLVRLVSRCGFVKPSLKISFYPIHNKLLVPFSEQSLHIIFAQATSVINKIMTFSLISFFVSIQGHWSLRGLTFCPRRQQACGQLILSAASWRVQKKRNAANRRLDIQCLKHCYHPATRSR